MALLVDDAINIIIIEYFSNVRFFILRFYCVTIFLLSLKSAHFMSGRSLNEHMKSFS